MNGEMVVGAVICFENVLEFEHCFKDIRLSPSHSTFTTGRNRTGTTQVSATSSYSNPAALKIVCVKKSIALSPPME